MRNPMYVERQAGPTWVKVSGAGAAVVVVVAAAVLIPAIIRTWGTSSTVILVAALIALVVIVGLAAVTGLLARISVRVEGGRVVGHLAPFRVFVVPVVDIIRTSHSEVSLEEAGGIGYRLRPDVRLLLFDRGPAVRFETRRGRTYVIRSDRGAEMVEAIAEARADRAQP
jgi:hypothetical protein